MTISSKRRQWPYAGAIAIRAFQPKVFVLSGERKGKLVSDLPYELARDVWKLVINVYELQFWL